MADAGLPDERPGETMLASIARRFMEVPGVTCVHLLVADGAGVLRLRRSAPEDTPAWAPPLELDSAADRAEITAGLERSLPEQPCARVLVLECGSRVVGVAALGFAETPSRAEAATLDVVAGMAGTALAGFAELERAEMRTAMLEGQRDAFMGAGETSSDVLLALDLDGGVVFWNSSCERLFGWSRDEVLGRPLPEPTVSRRTRLLDALRMWAAAGPQNEVELTLAHRGGAPVTLNAATTAIHDIDGHATAVLLRAIAFRMDDRMDEARGDMLSALADRIKAPLTALVGYVQLLERPEIAENASRRRRVVRSMAGHGEALSSLVDDLVLLSQLRRGEVRLNLEEMDLAATVSSIASRLDRHASGGFRIEADRNMRKVLADRRRVEQALKHLMCAGVAKATDSQDVVVSLGDWKRGATVAVTVPGCELTPEQQAAVFEDPFLLDESGGERRYGALFFAQSIAEAHGGGLNASAEERGLTFTMEIPRRPGASSTN